jgi:hypothetical protein
MRRSRGPDHGPSWLQKLAQEGAQLSYDQERYSMVSDRDLGIVCSVSTVLARDRQPT